MPILKIICQGEVCKIDKPPSLSIKTFKNKAPGKDGKWIFFKFEILAPIVPQLSKCLKFEAVWGVITDQMI